MPDESKLRKNYIDSCSRVRLKKIQYVQDKKKVWVSIDETFDVEDRYVAKFYYFYPPWGWILENP